MRIIYVQNDPINFIDPSGESIKSFARNAVNKISREAKTASFAAKNAVNAVKTKAYSSAYNSAASAAKAAQTAARASATGAAAGKASNAANMAYMYANEARMTGSSAAVKKAAQAAGRANSYANEARMSAPSYSKTPSAAPPKVEPINEQQAQQCSNNRDVIGNIGALGAGDFGADGLSDVWNRLVSWVKSDKGQKILMTVGSIAEIIGGGILTATGAGGPAGTMLLASGVSSLFGGYSNEKRGGSFLAGWVGGEISGALTGAGMGAGLTAVKEIVNGVAQTTIGVIKSLGTIVSRAFTGGSAGGFGGSLITQALDGEKMNFQEAISNGLINGTTAAISSPFGLVTTAISEASKGVSTFISTVTEGIFDLSSSLLSIGVS